MLRKILVTSLFCGLALWGHTAKSDELELGFGPGFGTYTLPVEIVGVGRRDLTFDTGASYTVLDKKDLEPLKLKSKRRASVFLPHEGQRKAAEFVVIPKMRIGECVLHDRTVVVMDLPEGRPGALGMSELEWLHPFTFLGNGNLRFRCRR